MKKLIFVLTLIFGSTGWAYNTDNQLIPQKELQLIKLLQQMEPEVLEEILSDAGVQWYLDGTRRFEGSLLSQSNEDDSFNSLTQPTELDYGHMKDDANAPTFD